MSADGFEQRCSPSTNRGDAPDSIQYSTPVTSCGMTEREWVEYPFSEELLAQRDHRPGVERRVVFCAFCGKRMADPSGLVLFATRVLDLDTGETKLNVWDVHEEHFERALHPDHRKTGLSYRDREERVQRGRPLATQCCICSEELENPHGFILEAVHDLDGSAQTLAWCAHEECFAASLDPEIRRMGESRSLVEASGGAEAPESVLSFKWEDEVEGKPIGPVRLTDWRRAVIRDYGWMSLEDAEQLARSLKLTLNEG